MSDSKIIGFANLDESNPFAVSVREYLQAAAAQHPEIQLIVRDNASDNDQASANVDEFVQHGVDLVIMFHIDERAGLQLIRPLQYHRIPVISVDIPIPMTTFLGINAELAGSMAGHALADWVEMQWDGRLDKVMVMTEYRVLDVIQRRFHSAIAALMERLKFQKDDLLMMDRGSERDVSIQHTLRVLETWSNYHHIGVVAINDYTAMGVLDAARSVGREADIAVISYDGTHLALQEFAKSDSRLIVSPSFRPDVYGEQLLALSLQLLNDAKVPRQNLVEPLCLTRDNYLDYV